MTKTLEKEKKLFPDKVLVVDTHSTVRTGI